jgi:hypothetical protein
MQMRGIHSVNHCLKMNLPKISIVEKATDLWLFYVDLYSMFQEICMML